MLFSRFCTSCFGELIDTLWNVNSPSIYFMKLVATELIDTLWNVNGDKLVLTKSLFPN